MTIGAYAGVALALGLVLVLLGLSLKLLQRLGPGKARGRVRLQMEVVQRLSIGPKQGIAVVRIGDRFVAVSMGDGGVRRLYELTEEESFVVSAALEQAAAPASAPRVAAAKAALTKGDFGSVFKGALRTAGFGALLLALLAGEASAQGSPVANAVNALANAASGVPPRTLGNAGTARTLGNAGTASNARTLGNTGGAASPASPASSASPFSLQRGNAATAAAGGAGLTPSAALNFVQRAQTAAAGGAAGTAGTAAGALTGAAAQAALRGAARAAAPSPAAAPVAAVPSAGADLAVAKLAPQMDVRIGGGSGDGLRLSGTVGIVVMMGLLTLLPTLILMMTSFTRILIVLSFLRQALGTQNAPPAQLVAAMSLLLTCFVMAPTLTAVNRDALQPWMNGKIEQGEMLDRGAKPFKAFMLRQTRDHDLQVFVDLSRGPKPATAADVPLITLMSAFVTSELRTAFQIGFALFLPFIIIDVVVSSVLMSMGMMMLPPAMISLPFKLLLFVLVDGWALIVQSLVASFR